MALLAPGVWVVGASGAIFGLFGALLVIGRHIGANIRNIAIVIGINFLYPFAIALISSIGRGSFTQALAAIQVSWQAHVGGLLVGALVGLIFARTRHRGSAGRCRSGCSSRSAWALIALLVVPATCSTSDVPRRESYPQVHPHMGMNHTGVISRGLHTEPVETHRASRPERWMPAVSASAWSSRKPAKAMPNPMTRFQAPMPGIGYSMPLR